MNSRNRVYQLAVAALLSAIGILIPMLSPIKLVLEPASFTLASHVAIFLAMFISPTVAVFVTVGTTLGFFLGGFPIVIVARAASHIIFVMTGALFLKKKPNTLDTHTSTALFALLVSLVHAAGEVLVVIPFYLSSNMAEGYYTSGFMVSVLLLVGVGTIVHSMVDFYISYFIWKPLKKAMPKL